MKLRPRPAAGDEDEPKVRILLVDDDERNLLAISQVLEDVAEVAVATSGREALRHLLKGDFAVILLDVFMPGIDGYETAQLIREREQTSRIPIIFLSAVNKETEHLMRGYAMGAVDYVFKPVDPIVLQSKIAVFVDLYRMRLQVEATARAEQELRDANHQTELRHLLIEQELKTTRERQAAILDALPIAIYEGRQGADGTQHRRFVGGDLERLTGVPSGELAADDALFWSRIHPDDRSRVASFFERSEDAAGACEYRWIGPDAKVRHFLDQAAKLAARAEHGLWAGTLIEITEQKLLEARVLQSGKLDALGQLTGGVAHDFNNLLASILGGISVLSRRVAFAESEAKVIELMRHAAQHGTELVKRMMAFSRQQELMPSDVVPAQLCEAVAGLVQPTLGGTVDLEWRCVEDLGSIFVDRTQLELALINLILNARDAMPGGGRIVIELAVEQVVADTSYGELGAGDYLDISVSDEGTGIAPELIAKVTDPFFTTKESGKGTGLGLSMVFGFVHQSGGTMRIVSEPDAGTTVHLLLPLAGDRGRPAQIAREAPSAPMAIGSVLLVDDDPAVRTIVAEQLTDCGLTVQVAPDAATALTMLAEAPRSYDLLLTDYAMPGMNGLTAIERAIEINPDQRVVLMTGYADETVLAKVGSSFPVLRKPIDIAALDRILTRPEDPAESGSNA